MQSTASNPVFATPHPIKVERPLPPLDAMQVPSDPDPECERLFRKQRLAAGYRIFSRFGFDNGGAGHITARDPEYEDHFWVNPLGVHFSQIRVSDLMLVSHNGAIVKPPETRPALLNKAAFAIHSQLHKARPDVVAAAHSHSLYGKIWSTLGRLLEPITQDAAAFYDDHAFFDDFTGVVHDLSEGARIAQALGRCQAVILKNHGILTVGASVEAAVWRYLSFENACKVQLLAESSGLKPHSMRPSVARLAASQSGGEIAGIYGFHPYWDVVTSEEPDLLS